LGKKHEKYLESLKGKYGVSSRHTWKPGKREGRTENYDTPLHELEKIMHTLGYEMRK